MFRGMQQRNLALQLIRSHYQQSFFSSRNTRAVVYFADDDNSYDAVFLDSLRFTNSISLFNVGLILDRRYEGPILENNKVIRMYHNSPLKHFALLLLLTHFAPPTFLRSPILSLIHYNRFWVRFQGRTESSFPPPPRASIY